LLGFLIDLLQVFFGLEVFFGALDVSVFFVGLVDGLGGILVEIIAIQSSKVRSDASFHHFGIL
jgi:hypothetical protein